MTKHHKWTEAETNYIRKTRNLPAKYVAHELGLTVSQVRNKRANVRKYDAPLTTKKSMGNINGMDGKLKQFELFNGAYIERRSLWQRLKALFTRG